MLRRIMILTLWLVGILFPMAGLGRIWPAYQQAFDALFAPEWMHIVMHLALFAGLAVLWVYALGKGVNPGSITGALLFVLLAGTLQELLQAWNAGIFWLPGILKDLGIDLVGGALGCGLAWIASRAWPARPLKKRPSPFPFQR